MRRPTSASPISVEHALIVLWSIRIDDVLHDHRFAGRGHRRQAHPGFLERKDGVQLGNQFPCPHAMAARNRFLFSAAMSSPTVDRPSPNTRGGDGAPRPKLPVEEQEAVILSRSLALDEKAI